MKQRKLWLIMNVVALVAILVFTTTVHGQEERYIYSISETDSSYDIVATETERFSSRVLASIPKRSVETFDQIATPEELKFAQNYFEAGGRDGTELAKSFPSVKIRLIAVAPSSQEIAITVEYSRCYQNFSSGCFGATRLLKLDTASGKFTSLFTLQFHDLQYTDLCPRLAAPTEELVIQEIRWKNSDDLLIASISGSFRCFLEDRPRVVAATVIPLNTSIEAFKIDDMVVWDYSETPYMLIGAHRECPKNNWQNLKLCTDTFSVYEIDLQNRIVESVKYPPIPTGTFINPEKGIAWAKGRAFFFTSQFIVPEGFAIGFGVFSPRDATPIQTMLLGKLDGAPVRFESSNDGSIALVQTSTGKLWSLDFVNGEVQTTEFYADPVTAWWWGPDNQVLVQKPDGSYVILNEQGAEVRQIDIDAAVRSVETGNETAKLIAIDW